MISVGMCCSRTDRRCSGDAVFVLASIRAALPASVLVASMLFVGAASAQSAAPRSELSTGATSMPGDTRLARQDIAFLKQAAEYGHAEIEGSRVALKRSTNVHVRAFAQQTVDDHVRAGTALRELAAAKGIDLPSTPSLGQRALLKGIEGLRGPTFDRRYADAIGISAHQDSVRLFRRAASDARDSDVKEFAAKTLPILEHHLDAARRLPSVTTDRK